MMNALEINESKVANRTNDPYSHTTVFKSVFITLSILITLSNAIVLLLYHINPRIRSTKNLLLASLALSDLSAGIVIIPIQLSCFQDGHWDICITCAILFRFLAFSTMLHILCIIFEKYISILHPFYIVQMKHLRVVSVCIWGISFLVAALPMAWLHPEYPGDPDALRKELVYFLATFAGLFVIPFILIVFAQVRMLRTISRSFTFVENVPTSPTNPLENRIVSELINETGSTRTSLHNRKVLTAFALMLGTFTVCWLTWYMGLFFVHFDKEMFRKFDNDIRYAFTVLVFLPSLINPLLYTYYKQDFRRALQALLKSFLKMLCY